MNWRSAIAALFGAFLIFAAGGTHVVYGTPPTDPCSLLTSAQVSAAFGVTVGAEKETGGLDCQWSQPGEGLAGKGALLHLLGTVGRLTPVDQFNTTKMPLPIKGVTKTPVSGVGDDAVYVTTGALTGLTVRKGNSVFQIRVYGFPPEQIKAKEKTLALEVLARL